MKQIRLPFVFVSQEDFLACRRRCKRNVQGRDTFQHWPIQTVAIQAKKEIENHGGDSNQDSILNILPIDLISFTKYSFATWTNQ